MGRGSLVSLIPKEGKLINMELRIYSKQESIVFHKTSEPFGGLSNMAPGFPIEVNGIKIRTSEALYQACRFPHLPKIQKIIIDQFSPMTAKMKSKPYHEKTRRDWLKVRISIMRWCLKVKLIQNWESFGSLLISTGDKPIVEESNKDDFWGAKPKENEMLVGANILGRLLMELRQELINDSIPSNHIKPLNIPYFFLYGNPINSIERCFKGIESINCRKFEQLSIDALLHNKEL